MPSLEHVFPGNWDTVRRNFERLDAVLEALVNTPRFITASPAGGWVGTPVNFTSPVAGPALVIGQVTAYTTTGVDINCQMRVNGVLIDTGGINQTIPLSSRLTLSPMVGVTTLVKGANTFSFTITSGTSDAGDRGRFIAILGLTP